MTQQSETLRLAVLGSFRGGLTLGEVQEAEDELNRLIAQRDALLEALTLIASDACADMPVMMQNIARAAIKAAEETA